MRALLAGAVGGVVGGWIKIVCEGIYPPRPDGRPAPPAVLLEKIARDRGQPPLTQAQSERGTMAIHWIFSAVFGGIYGILAEPLPIVRSGCGIGYGLAVWAGGHELSIPALKLSPPARRLAAQEHGSEAFSHAGFGLTLELTRRLLRSTLLQD